MTCSTVPHLDPSLWNTGHASSHALNTFWPERFLKSSDDRSLGPERAETAGDRQSRSDACLHNSQQSRLGCAAIKGGQFSTRGLEGIWMPFGGGKQMCPGRNFAKAAAVLVAALVLTDFDVQLCDAQLDVPMNMSYFGTGVLKPGAMAPFRFRKRAVAANPGQG